MTSDMTPDRWRRIEALFEACLELEPVERRALLDGRCADDDELRLEVEALLEHAEPVDRLEQIVDRSRHQVFAPASGEPSPGDRIGPYRLEDCLGEGGMGSVWRARRVDDAFEQRVAIKFVGRVGQVGQGKRSFEERFLTERQILARLEHPHIARLLDGGSTDEGRPYLVMELVEGEELMGFCDRRRLGLEERLRLFLRVASAVEHAHRHLVVHRDLKPANILVHPESGPKLLDFGIAKLLEPASELSAPAPTQLQDRLLTPDYASPEQILGQPVTTASDVYSLGVLLYELLTGERPRSLRRLSPARREQELTSSPPRRPSTRVRRSRTDAVTDGVANKEASGDADGSHDPARLRGLSPRQLVRRLKGDLDTIVLRALHTEPERRYGSVAELAFDIERHLRGEPVLARPDSWRYRMGKLVRRHPWGTAAVATIALLTITLVVALALHSDRLADERDRALAAESEARTVSDFLMHLFEVADPGQSRGETVTARELLDRGSELIRTSLDEEPEAQASLLSTLADVHSNLGLLDRAEELHRLALERRQEHLGESHPDTAASLDRLGDTLRRVGSPDEAEEALRQALEIRRQQVPTDLTAVAESLNNLGLLLLERGDYEPAEPLLRQSLEINLAQLGPDHPNTEAARSNLGQVLLRTRRFAEAEPVLEAVVESRLRRLGENHPKVANSLHVLASLRNEEGRFEESEALFRRAIRIRQQVLPPDHPHLAASLNNLASLLHDQWRLEEAEDLYRRSIAIEGRGDNAKGIGAAYSLNNLGSLLEDRGRYPEAEELYLESLEIRGHAFGEDSRPYRRLLSTLGRLAVRAGDLALAEERLRDAGAWLEANLEPDDPDRIRLLERLGLLARARGDFETSTARFAEALDAASRAYGPGHGIHAELRAELAQALAESPLPEPCAEAVEQARAAIDPDRASVVVRGRVELAAGLCWQALGRTDEAEAALRSALDLLRPGLGDDNHWVRAAASHLPPTP